jgi:hypothetical protein
MFDPFRPQPYNVDIGNEPEGADAQPRYDLVAPPIPYELPVLVSAQPDRDLYPPRRHGVFTPRRGM